jgi:hypothetical protein
MQNEHAVTGQRDDGRLAVDDETKKPSSNRRLSYIPLTFPDKSQTQLFGFRVWRWDARTGKRHSNIHWLVSQAIHLLWYRSLGCQLICGIAQELRMSARRIRKIYKSPSCLSEPTLGRLGGIQYHTQYAQLHACSQDMQTIANRADWATNLDRKVWVEAWAMGARFGNDNAHIEELREVLEPLAR